MKIKFISGRNEKKWKTRFFVTLGFFLAMGIYTAITYEPPWELWEEARQMSLLRP